MIGLRGRTVPLLHEAHKSVLQRSGGLRSIAILRYNKGRVPSTVSPVGSFIPYYIIARRHSAIHTVATEITRRRARDAPPPRKSRFAILRIRQLVLVQGRRGFRRGFERICRSFTIVYPNGAAMIRDAAFRNLSGEEKKKGRGKKKESQPSRSTTASFPVDAQPPIRNYSQILKSNMAVSSCQSEIARKSEKRFADGGGGATNAVRSDERSGARG